MDFGIFDKLIECGQKLGGLSAATIFALISIVQGYVIFKKEKAAEKWIGVREGQIIAEHAQTEVMARSVDVISMNTTAINALVAKVDRMAIIIEERIPRKAV